MRTILRVGFEENDLGADLFGGAQSFGERIGRFHGHVYRAIVFGVFCGGRGTQNHRHFRKAVQSAAVGRLEETRQLHRDDLRFFGQQEPAQCYGELDASRNDGEITHSPALQAAELDVSFE